MPSQAWPPRERVPDPPAKRKGESDGFIDFRDKDCFWYDDVEQVLASDLAACKLLCRQRGYGAFVVYNGVAYFRRQSPEECRQNLGDAPGATTYIDMGRAGEMPPQIRASLDRLADLGFDRAAALEALLACDCDEELAANYLFDAPRGEDDDSAGGGASLPSAPPETGGGGSRSALFEELRSDPKFPELAQLIAQSPQLLPTVIQALQQTHPSLQQALAANQVEFLRMVHEAVGHTMSPVNTMLAAAAAQAVAQGPAAQVSGTTAASGRAATGQATAHERRATAGGGLSAADQAAVQRIASRLGFPWASAAEAYLQCGRDEEHASRALVEGASRLYTD